MTNMTNLWRIGSLILLTFTLLFSLGLEANAQKRDYKATEKIEYKSSGYPEIWEEATFVRSSPDGSQAIIRQKPNEFSKDGFQRAASWSEIRSPLAKITTRVDDDTTTGDLPAVDTNAIGLISQNEVLTFLRNRMGDKPFQNPRRDEIKTSLAEMIKRRGLDFRFSLTDPDFYKTLAKYGAITSDVSFPLRDNYGEPTVRSWRLGAWNLGKIGAAVDYKRNGRVYRQGEIGVNNVGTLTISADGTYVWRSVTAQSTAGNWREATKTEMRSKGGDGIVLVMAKSGYDWIVSKNRTTELKGDWLDISELATRQINEYGSRNGKK